MHISPGIPTGNRFPYLSKITIPILQMGFPIVISLPVISLQEQKAVISLGP